jgi:FtsZ-binding cell division protein ZapB
VRLTPEQVAEEKKYLSEFKEMLWFGEHVLTSVEQDLFDTIETLQAENEQLKADCDRFKERLQISPYGDDKIDELDEALENCKFQYEQLKQENEQLRAQVARVREALTIANNYMPDVGHFCTCGQCKTCGTNISYSGYGHCLKCARNIIDTALSDTSADYHNPADVEALIMAMEAIKAAWSDRSVNAALDKASEALTKISKALEVRE